MHTQPPPAGGDTPAPPARIDPDAWYDDAALRLLIGVTGATLRTARRVGILRHARRGVKKLHRGSWVIAWLEGGVS